MPHYNQGDRDLLTQGQAEVKTFRKTARILARQQDAPFSVTTAAGDIMHGEAGDWLATNHPVDDPGSDIWVITAERVRDTFTEANPGVPGMFVNRESNALAEVEKIDEDGFVTLHIIKPNPGRHSMPVAEYDSVFVTRWRPVTERDLVAPPGVRAPRNAPPDWGSE